MNKLGVSAGRKGIDGVHQQFRALPASSAVNTVGLPSVIVGPSPGRAEGSGGVAKPVIRLGSDDPYCFW